MFFVAVIMLLVCIGIPLAYAWRCAGTILALLGSIERAEILIHRIDAERRSVNRQSVLARVVQKKDRARPMNESGFSPVPTE